MENLEKIRKPAVVGSFYPQDKAELKLLIEGFLKQASEIKLKGKPKALIVPHAGYIYSGPIAAVAYKLLKKTYDRKLNLKVLLLGPAHQILFKGAAIDESDSWETPLGRISNIKLARQKQDSSKVAITNYKWRNLFFSSAPHLHEHCLEVQLPFLQLVLKNFQILPILIGEAEPKDLAADLEKIIDAQTLLIISSDLSHYLPYEEAKRIDFQTCQTIKALDIERFEKIGDACGKKAISTLLYLAKSIGWQAKLLDYRNSGDTAGEKGQVVGYASFGFIISRTVLE